MTRLCPHYVPLKSPWKCHEKSHYLSKSPWKFPLKSPSKKWLSHSNHHQNGPVKSRNFWTSPKRLPSHLHQPHLPHQLHPSPPAQCLAEGLHRCPEAAERRERGASEGLWESKAAMARSLPGSTPQKNMWNGHRIYRTWKMLAKMLVNHLQLWHVLCLNERLAAKWCFGPGETGDPGRLKPCPTIN